MIQLEAWKCDNCGGYTTEEVGAWNGLDKPVCSTCHDEAKAARIDFAPSFGHHMNEDV